jgi:DNA-binding FadR family transcriptional regulator
LTRSSGRIVPIAGTVGVAVPASAPITAPRRLYREIAGQLEALISRGEFPPGTRLPAERELAKLFGVSRPPVREALLSLEIAGLVDVRIGSGVWVVEPPKAAATATPDAGEPGPFELIEARKVLEGEIAAIAASVASEHDLAGILETIEQMIAENARHAVEQEADRLFHLRVAAATGNSTFVHLMRSVWEFRYGPMWNKIEEHFLTPQRREQTVKDHQAVYQALKARDPDRARAAMHRHLNRVQRQFAKEWDEANPPAKRPARR